MMKGSITVFLALSLSVLTGFVLLLTGNAVRNAEKIRLEGAVDLGMNSVLGEFHTGLHDRYGLLYIDLSYEEKKPSLRHPESRLDYYIRQNTKKGVNGPWGEVVLDRVELRQVATAAYGNGNSMKYQAVCYMQDSGGYGAYRGNAASAVQGVIGYNAMAKWSMLMEHIAGMELPMILNEHGELVEVPLENPADAVYELTGQDLLQMIGIDTSSIGVGLIRVTDYASGRVLHNTEFGEEKEADTELFISYLFEKMGNYGRIREESFLQYQLEYIAMGKCSDYENIQAVAEQLLEWRFAKNVELVMGNSTYYEEALAIADSLQAVRLDHKFREPVAESILYARAFSESLSELRCLMKGGSVEGFCYEEYLFVMIRLLSESDRNLRSMDIMEMDIRMISQNPLFSMDFCVERLEAEIRAGSYYMKRTYGYY